MHGLIFYAIQYKQCAFGSLIFVLHFVKLNMLKQKINLNFETVTKCHLQKIVCQKIPANFFATSIQNYASGVKNNQQ